MLRMTFEAMATALALLNNTIELARTMGAQSRNGERDISASVVVQRLPGEAYASAQRLLADLRQLRADLETAGVDLGKSAEDLEADPGWWGTRRYTAIKNIQPVLGGTRDRLNMLFNDLVAVAQCFRAEELVARTFAEARSQQRKIRDMIEPSRPIKEVINDAEDLIDQIAGQLGAVR